jgi:hypothetical protein
MLDAKPFEENGGLEMVAKNYITSRGLAYR